MTVECPIKNKTETGGINMPKKGVAYKILVMEDGDLIPVDLDGKKLPRLKKDEDVPPITMQTLSINLFYCSNCVCFINGRRYRIC